VQHSSQRCEAVLQIGWLVDFRANHTALLIFLLRFFGMKVFVALLRTYDSFCYSSFTNYHSTRCYMTGGICKTVHIQTNNQYMFRFDWTLIRRMVILFLQGINTYEEKNKMRYYLYNVLKKEAVVNQVAAGVVRICLQILSLCNFPSGKRSLSSWDSLT
jgi:hypothetical protein